MSQYIDDKKVDELNNTMDQISEENTQTTLPQETPEASQPQILSEAKFKWTRVSFLVSGVITALFIIFTGPYFGALTLFNLSVEELLLITPFLFVLVVFCYVASMVLAWKDHRKGLSITFILLLLPITAWFLLNYLFASIVSSGFRF